jgi:glycosyltransferase involved in cell wall biosynthesis
VKKKLLIIGSSQGFYGGIEAFMISIAEAAMRWPEFEVKLCFKLIKGAQVDESLANLAEKKCPNVFYVRRGSIKLAKIIFDSNILHIQNAPPDIIIFGRLMFKKLLLTIHHRRQPRISFHNIIWSLSIKLAHQRWYNSNFVWNTWEQKNKSIKSKCIPTIGRLPMMRYSKKDRKGFIFIGRWIKNKGIEEILRAYAKNKFNIHEWPLTILGDGPLKPKILNLIDELGLNGIKIPGFVSERKKIEYLVSARWLLAPANTNEDLGLTPIEARGIGVPSIVTRDGGLLESGGPSALIAEPGNIDDLARCMKYAVRMSEIEYIRRSKLAYNSLSDYLKPICFYRQEYNRF